MSTFNAGGIVGQELGAVLTQALDASTLCTQAATLCTQAAALHLHRLQPHAGCCPYHPAPSLPPPCVQALGVSTSAEGGGTDFSHLFDLVLICNLASLLPLFVPQHG